MSDVNANTLRAPVNPAKPVYQYYLMTGEFKEATDGWVPTDHTGNPVESGTFGNILGLIDRLPEIKKMGMDTVWVGPVPTANIRSGHGYGYDAIDYDTVNPLYGSDEHFKQLMEAAHKQGLNVILDQVYNHTSMEHPWFQASRDVNHPEHKKFNEYYIWQEPIIGQHWNDNDRDKAPAIEVILRDSHGLPLQKLNSEGKPLGEYMTATLKPIYHYHDGPMKNSETGEVIRDEHGNPQFPLLKTDDGHLIYPPSNVACVSMDLAWTYDSERKAFYLHTFHESMPDLNIGNPEVDRALIDSAKGWITDKGADGFRLDAAQHISSHWTMRHTGEKQYQSLLNNESLKWRFGEALGADPDSLTYDTLSPEQKLTYQTFLAGMNGNPPNTLRAIGKVQLTKLVRDHRDQLESWLPEGSHLPEGGYEKWDQDTQWRMDGTLLRLARQHASELPDILIDVIDRENPSPTHKLIENARAFYELDPNTSAEDVLLFLGSIDVTHNDELEHYGGLFNAGFRSQLHVRDVSQPDGIAFWKQFSDEVKALKGPNEKPVSLLFENGDNLHNLDMMVEAGVIKADQDSAYVSTFDGARSPSDLRRSVEELGHYGREDFAQGEFISFTPSNHDTRRIASRFGFEDNPKAVKLLHTFFSRLPGNICIYNGEELGLSSPTGREIANLERDPFNYLMKRTSFNYGGADQKTHDYDRAAYPRSEADFDSSNLLGAQGRFFKAPDSWQGHSYAEQARDSDSVLRHFTKALEKRAQDPVLSTFGDIQFLNYDYNDGQNHHPDTILYRQENVLIYARSNGQQTHLFMDNFSNQEVTINVPDLIRQNVDGLPEHIQRDLERLATTAEQMGTTDLVLPPYETQQLGNVRMAEQGLARSA